MPRLTPEERSAWEAMLAEADARGEIAQPGTRTRVLAFKTSRAITALLSADAGREAEPKPTVGSSEWVVQNVREALGAYNRDDTTAVSCVAALVERVKKLEAKTPPDAGAAGEAADSAVDTEVDVEWRKSQGRMFDRITVAASKGEPLTLEPHEVEHLDLYYVRGAVAKAMDSMKAPAPPAPARDEELDRLLSLLRERAWLGGNSGTKLHKTPPIGSQSAMLLAEIHALFARQRAEAEGVTVASGEIIGRHIPGDSPAMAASRVTVRLDSLADLWLGQRVRLVRDAEEAEHG